MFILKSAGTVLRSGKALVVMTMYCQWPRAYTQRRVDKRQQQQQQLRQQQQQLRQQQQHNILYYLCNCESSELIQLNRSRLQ